MSLCQSILWISRVILLLEKNKVDKISNWFLWKHKTYPEHTAWRTSASVLDAQWEKFFLENCPNSKWSIFPNFRTVKVHSSLIQLISPFLLQSTVTYTIRCSVLSLIVKSRILVILPRSSSTAFRWNSWIQRSIFLWCPSTSDLSLLDSLSFSSLQASWSTLLGVDRDWRILWTNFLSLESTTLFQRSQQILNRKGEWR